MKNTLKKIVGSAFAPIVGATIMPPLKKALCPSRGGRIAAPTVLLLAAFAWMPSAQAWVEQGVMRYQTSGTNIRVQGYYNNRWVYVCYGDQGFNLVQSGLNGASVQAVPEFKSGGKFVKMAWKVTAGANAVVNGMISPHTDVQIGDNDYAAIEIMKTGRGVVKGIKMVDDHTYDCGTRNAQLNLYFRGTADVTDCDTYWFGYWSSRTSYHGKQIVKDGPGYQSYAHHCDDSANPTLVTSYEGRDSGCIHTWYVNLQPGESKTYSFLLGIGEKSDPPEWYYEAGQEVDDALKLFASDRTLTSLGKGTDVVSSGNIMMYVMSTPNKFGSEGEKLLATVAAAGKETPVQLAGDIDTTGWEKGLYILDYWLVNDKGAMSADTIRKPIQIMEDGTLNANPGDETTYLVEGTCENANNFTNFTIRVFGVGQDPNNTGVAATNDYDAVIDEKGSFYSLLPDGHFDVVITAWPKDGTQPYTTTAMVEVDGAETTLTVTLPLTRVNSIINDEATKFNGTVAGGLDLLGEAAKSGDASITNIVSALDVVDKDETAEHASELKEAAVGTDPTRLCDFVDLSLWIATNQVTNVIHATSTITSDPEKQLIRIGLPFADPKHCYVRVHRWHNDQVEQIPEGAANATADGEYFTISQNEGAMNGEVLLFVKNFSLYCISRGKEYATLRLNQPEHGTVELATDADFTQTIGDKYSPLWTESNVFVRCTNVDEGWIFRGFEAAGLSYPNTNIVLSQARDFVKDSGSGEYYWTPIFKFKETPAYSNVNRKVACDTMEEILALTMDGETVVLTRDAVVDGALQITKPIVFGGNGHSLKVATPYVKGDGSINASASAGGVIEICSGISATVTNMLIEGGAGAYAIRNKGVLVIDDVTIQNSNGAVESDAGTYLLVRNSRIGHNVAETGAAVASAGKVVLDGSSFCENRATMSGGALYATAATAKFYGNNVVFGNNSAMGSGGAAVFPCGEAYFHNATFAGNLATAAGGAIGVGATATAKFANSVLANNVFYDTTGLTVAADDLDAAAGATVEIRACAYGVVAGATPEGGAAVTAASEDLFASYTSLVRLYGTEGSTAAAVEHLPVFGKKDAGEALSLYAALADTSSYLTVGAPETYFAVSNNATLDVTLKGTGYTYAEEVAGVTATVPGNYEGGIRSPSLPGASGTTTPILRYVLRLKESPANGSVSGITLYGNAYTNGEEVTVVATPDAGAYFLGWYDAADETTPLTTDATYVHTMTAANKVLVAKFAVLQDVTTLWVNQESWIAGETVPDHTYGGNPGTGAESFEYAPTNNTSLWAVTKPSNAGTYYIRYSVAEAIPYKAASVTNVFLVGANVFFDANGGTFSNGATVTNVVTDPTCYVAPAENPTRKGYYLAHLEDPSVAVWYDAPEGGNPFVPGDPVTTTNFYARWKPNPTQYIDLYYYVGQPSVQTQQTRGTGMTLPKDWKNDTILTNENDAVWNGTFGYTFAGWSTTNEWTDAYGDACEWDEYGAGIDYYQGLTQESVPEDSVATNLTYWALWSFVDWWDVGATNAEGTVTGDVKATLVEYLHTLTVTGTVENAKMADAAKPTDDWTDYAAAWVSPWHNMDEKLVENVIVSNVSYIGAYAFYGLQNLYEVFFSGAAPTAGEGAFSNCTYAVGYYEDAYAASWASVLDAEGCFQGLKMYNRADLPTFANPDKVYVRMDADGSAHISVADGLTEVTLLTNPKNVLIVAPNGVTVKEAVAIPEGRTEATISSFTVGGGTVTFTVSGTPASVVIEGKVNLGDATWTALPQENMVIRSGATETTVSVPAGEYRFFKATATPAP